MNKYIRALYVLPTGAIKVCLLKLFHPKSFCAPVVAQISPLSEITLEHGASLSFGIKFRLRDGAKLRIRRGGELKIGNNTSVNSNNFIVCHDRITIGDNVQLSPNVQIYDHDHDYRAEGGVGAMKYRTAPVEIGNNVWIGANCVILRGTKIGDNCVIAAGSIVKGEIPSDTLVVQKRSTEIISREIKT